MSYASTSPLDEEIDPLESTDDELEGAAMHVIGEDGKEGEISEDDDLNDIVVVKLGPDEKVEEVEEVEERPKSALEELEELERKLHSGELDGDKEDEEETDKIESFDDEEE